MESRIKNTQGSDDDKNKDSKVSSDSEDDPEDRGGDYSSSDDSEDSDLGNEMLDEARRNQRFEDDSRIAFYDYQYCVSKDDSIPTSDFIKRETQMRKLQFILSEIINDMGIKKSDFWEWTSTLSLASFVFWMRMLIHYIGQWIFLKVVDAPVEHTVFHWYELDL